MFCLNCGQKVPDGAKFCLNCGTAMPDVQNTQQPVPNVQQPAQEVQPPVSERPAAQYSAEVVKKPSAKRNIIILVIVAVVLIVGGVVGLFATGAVGGNDPEKILETAERYLDEKDYEEAIIQFEKLLEIDPLNVDAYLGLAEAYEEMGDTDKADEVLSAALKELKDEDDIRKIRQKTNKTLEIAERYLDEKDYEEAIIWFEKLLKIDPLNVDAYLGLAEAYEEMGDTDKAIDVLEKALDRLKDEDDVKRIEEALAKLNKPDDTAEAVPVTPNTEPAATTTTAVTTTTEPADNADIKYEDFVGIRWRSYEVTLGNETTDTYRTISFYPDHIFYAGGMFQCDGRNISTDGNSILFDIVGAECKLIYNNEDDTLTLIRVIDGQTETQVFYRDGFNELAQTTVSTTTTFPENSDVSDAVQNMDVTKLDNPDLEVTERIEWMAWWDMDETTPAAMLFKETYGIPESGKDPDRDGRIFDYTNVSYVERYDRLSTAIASGNSPDIFPFEALDFPYGVLKGRYQPVSDIINIDSPKWDAARPMMEQFRFGDDYYCAFYEISFNNLMYYKKSNIDAIGVQDPRTMFENGEWTWDAFLDISRKWQESGDYKFCIDGFNPENDLIISTGVPMIGNDGTELINNLHHPAIERAEELLTTLQQENLRYPRHELNGWSVNPKAWAYNFVLFYADGGMWVYESTLSTFEKAFGWSKDEIQVVPFPRDPQADAHYILAKQDALMWVKGSDNADGVAAWLDCCVTAYQDPEVREAAKAQQKENYGWSDNNLDAIYAWTALDGTSPLTPIFDFKGGLGAVSDGSDSHNPVQSLTNMVYLSGEQTYTQLRAEHEPAIQAAIDDINAYIDKIS